MAPLGLAQGVDDGGLGKGGQVADGADAEALKPFEGGGADAPQGLHGVRMEEGELGARGDHMHGRPRLHAAAGHPGLGRLRRQFGDELAGAGAHRRRQPQLLLDTTSHLDGQLLGRTEKATGAADVEERLVEGDALHQRRERQQQLV